MTESINKGDIFHHNDDDMKYEILHHANVNCKNKNFIHQIVCRCLDTGDIHSYPKSDFQESFYKSSVGAMWDNIENICKKANSVVYRWDTLDWIEKERMGECINALRTALQQLKETK